MTALRTHGLPAELSPHRAAALSPTRGSTMRTVSDGDDGKQSPPGRERPPPAPVVILFHPTLRS